MEKVKLDLKEKHEVVEILGTEALFVGYRVSRSQSENGLYIYHLRHDDAGEFCEISYPVMVNLAASILSKKAINFGPISTDNINFLGYEASIEEFTSPEWAAKSLE